MPAPMLHRAIRIVRARLPFAEGLDFVDRTLERVPLDRERLVPLEELADPERRERGVRRRGSREDRLHEIEERLARRLSEAVIIRTSVEAIDDRERLVSLFRDAEERRAPEERHQLRVPVDERQDGGVYLRGIRSHGR